MARPKSIERRAQVPLPPGLARQVTDYRFDNRISTEAEAIRQLIERGLEAVKAATPKKAA